MISFGPIPSRRLGKSLGINNIFAPKVCSYGCIYCQVGKTTKYSLERQEFFKPEVIFKEVRNHIQNLNSENYPDYLSFVSNGEPTLDINLGNSVRLLKNLNIPIAVFTNGSLLGLESVRQDIKLADWVSIKIDAGDSPTWHSVNQPQIGLDFDRQIDYIRFFVNEYKGTLCTETMLVKGINDSYESILKISKIIAEMKPEKAYLSIPTRPPAMASVKAPDPEKLNLAWHIFNKKQIKTEILTGFEGTDTGFTGSIYEDILNITAVHPLREDSMLKLLQNDNVGYSVIDSLIHQRLIKTTIYEGNKYFIRAYHPRI